MCLANYVHPKKVIVGPQKLFTDATFSQVDMRRMDPQQLLRRYGILKALPPHDILDELLMVPNFNMCHMCFHVAQLLHYCVYFLRLKNQSDMSRPHDHAYYLHRKGSTSLGPTTFGKLHCMGMM